MKIGAKKDHKLSCGNVIIYPGGNITILKYSSYHNVKTGERREYLYPLCDTTIDSIVKYDKFGWVQVSEWIGTSVDYRGGRIFGGGGAMEQDGFIACVDEAEHLIWAMSFDNTDPIESLEIKDNTLIAVSGDYFKSRLEINLNVLTDIKITPIDEKK